jgi:hypothetical protein
MELLIAFMLGVVVLSTWELHGGPRWRTPVVLVTCAVIAIGFTSLRVV